MKKGIIGILLSLIAFTNSMAQVMIGGHKPFYDARSQTFLIVTDSTSIENLTADVVPTDNSWSDIRIDDKKPPAGCALARRGNMS